MKKIKIEIDLSNDSFQGEYGDCEAAAVLRDLAYKYADNSAAMKDAPIMDSNGNTVGRFRVIR